MSPGHHNRYTRKIYFFKSIESVEKYPTEGHVSYHIPEAALLRVTKKTETPRMLKFGSTDSTILEYNGLNDHENIAQIYYKENWQTLAIHVCSTPELSPDYFIFGKQGLFYTKLLLIDALYYSSKVNFSSLVLLYLDSSEVVF
jgi:hypothetical protein